MEGNGRSAGEAASAATHAMALLVLCDADGRAGFDSGVSLPWEVSAELLILSTPFQLGTEPHVRRACFSLQ